MIRRLLLGSARRRLRHLGLIALAVVVAAGTVAAAAGLGARLAQGLRGALHAAGPNLVVRPQVGGPGRLAVAEIGRVRGMGGVEMAVGIAEGAAFARIIGSDGAPALELVEEQTGAGLVPVLAASPGLLELHPEWQLDGRVPGPGEALLGGRVGSEAVSRGTGGEALPVAGRLVTGEELDTMAVVPLEAVAAPPLDAARILDRIEVRAAPDRLEETAAAIEARVAGAEARPLARVTATDARLARSLQLLMAGVGAICLVLALVTVASATLALLEERRREMALFLSLGYTGRWVQGLLTAELSLVGLVSVAAGWLGGEAVAAVLARRLLGLEATFAPSAAGAAAGAAAVLVVVAAAAALVRRRVERLEPALVLQGN